MSFTNEEFVELVESFLRELRPTTAVRCGLGTFRVPGSDVEQEFLYIRKNDPLGPQTEVRFKKSELVGLSEAHIKVFLTTKLAAIVVTIAEVRERGETVITGHGESAQEFDGSVTPAELAQLQEMKARRNIDAPGQAEAQARVEQQLVVDPANVTADDLAAFTPATPVTPETDDANG